MTNTKTVCVSCDYLTNNREPLVLSNQEEIDHHKSQNHYIKEVYENPKDQSKELAEFVISNTKKMIISENDTSRIYAIVTVDNHNETIEIGTQRSIDWLIQAYYKETQKIISNTTSENTINFVRAQAIFSPKINHEKIFRRNGFSNGKLLIDLGDKDWKLVEISSDGIRHVDYSEKTNVFVRSKNMAKQVNPRLKYDGNPLDKLGQLIRMDDDLFKVHIISFFLEGIPTPIMANLVHAGGAKTTVSGMVRQIIDPAGSSITDNVTAFPSKSDNFAVQFENNYLIAYENISSINQEKSDILCRVTTGSTITTRKHYTNDEEQLMKFQRKIILNGIAFEMGYEDLADRTIQYWFERIPEDKRLSDEQVSSRFKELLPDLLGQIFEILHKAMKLYPTVQCKNIPRMASFAIWGESIYQVLGHKQGEFLELYNKAIKKNTNTLFENNPIIPFLDSMLDVKSELKTQTNQFFKELKSWSENNNYQEMSSLPKASNQVTRWITRSKQLLDEHGYSISWETNTERNEFTPGSTVLSINRITKL